MAISFKVWRSLLWVLPRHRPLDLLMFAVLLVVLCGLDLMGRRIGMLTYHHGWPAGSVLNLWWSNSGSRPA